VRALTSTLDQKEEGLASYLSRHNKNKGQGSGASDGAQDRRPWLTDGILTASAKIVLLSPREAVHVLCGVVNS
jgi:hypothetical protein